MNSNFSQVSAFVLHSKNYQENSQIIQLFSLELGRFSVIAKGIKGKRSQARKAILQPFSELKIQFTGKSDLKTLTHCEVVTETANQTMSQNRFFGLQGKALACGYYANELILRACIEQQEYHVLFTHYREFISSLKAEKLESEKIIAPTLRDFEIALLTDIGLAPDCLFDIEHNEIKADEWYFLVPEYGFQPQNHSENKLETDDFCGEPAAEYEVKSTHYKKQYDSYIGQAILSLASGVHFPEHYKSSQQIMAAFLREVIGNKPLQSRKLWQHLSLNGNQLKP